MTTGLAMPNIAFVQETLVQEYRRIAPPDYWTTLKDVEPADHPQFVSPESMKPHPGLLTSVERHSARIWVEGLRPGSYRDEQNARLDKALLSVVAWTVKAGKDLGRQVAFAMADIVHLMEWNRGRDRPGYTGANDWGLTTRQSEDMRVQYVDAGVAIIWAYYAINTNFPLPKG